jgi:peptidoglycan biosynthesis protein MviN/MurJ (putative lipid II flippase)
VAAAVWLVGPDLPLAARLDRLALALAWGTVAGALLQVAVQLPACWRLLAGSGWRLALRAEGLRDVLVAWTPVVIGAGFAQISGVVDTILGSLIGEGGVASLVYAQTLQVLPISLFGVSVAAVALPDLARDATGPPASVLRARLSVGFRRIAFFVVPSAFAFVGLGHCSRPAASARTTPDGSPACSQPMGSACWARRRSSSWPRGSTRCATRARRSPRMSRR